MKLAIFALAFMIVGGNVASAQQHNLSLYGKAGYSNTSEDEGPLGNGAVFGAGLTRQLTDHWDLGIELSRYRNNRPGGPGLFFHDGHTVTASGSASYFIGKSRVRPYLRLGFAYARMEAARGFRPSPSDPGMSRTGSQSFWGPDLGIGLAIPVAGRFSLSPEARLFVGSSGNFDPFSDVVEPPLILASFAVALSYRW